MGRDGNSTLTATRPREPSAILRPEYLETEVCLVVTLSSLALEPLTVVLPVRSIRHDTVVDAGEVPSVRLGLSVSSSTETVPYVTTHQRREEGPLDTSPKPHRRESSTTHPLEGIGPTGTDSTEYKAIGGGKE